MQFEIGLLDENGICSIFIQYIKKRRKLVKKFASARPIAVLKSGLKNNWMGILNYLMQCCLHNLSKHDPEIGPQKAPIET